MSEKLTKRALRLQYAQLLSHLRPVLVDARDKAASIDDTRITGWCSYFIREVERQTGELLEYEATEAKREAEDAEKARKTTAVTAAPAIAGTLLSTDAGNQPAPAPRSDLAGILAALPPDQLDNSAAFKAPVAAAAAPKTAPAQASKPSVDQALPAWLAAMKPCTSKDKMVAQWKRDHAPRGGGLEID